MYNIQEFIQYLGARDFEEDLKLNNQVSYSHKDGRAVIFPMNDVIDIKAIAFATRRIEGLSETDFLSYLKRKKAALKRKKG